MKPDVLVRIVVDHDDGDYHEWVTNGDRVRADRLGRANRRMWSPNWTKWMCNGCPAWALVSDDLVRISLQHAEPRGCLPAGPPVL